jgi:hypothetical protein
MTFVSIWEKKKKYFDSTGYRKKSSKVDTRHRSATTGVFMSLLSLF